MNTDTPSEGLPYFRGRTKFASYTNGYTYIDWRTVIQIDGPSLELPQNDLLIHVNENRDLGDPIPADSWITFFLREERRRKTGLEVFGGQFDRAVAPA